MVEVPVPNNIEIFAVDIPSSFKGKYFPRASWIVHDHGIKWKNHPPLDAMHLKDSFDSIPARIMDDLIAFKNNPRISTCIEQPSGARQLIAPGMIGLDAAGIDVQAYRNHPPAAVIQDDPSFKIIEMGHVMANEGIFDRTFDPRFLGAEAG